MNYKRFSDTIMLYMSPGEEIIEQLALLQEKENIQAASVMGIGAVNELQIAVYKPDLMRYDSRDFTGYYEISSLVGTMSRKEGKPYLHIHVNAGDEEGRVFGGHLNRAVISATAEIVVRIIDGKVERKFDDSIGLFLFDF